ncbi:hypothetical protein U3516DRAFT_824525 [Neocallimastix sp. 'constans']
MSSIENVINDVINNIKDDNDRQKVREIVALLTDINDKDKNEELKYKRKNNLLKKKISALEKIQLLQEVFIAENSSQNEASKRRITENQLTPSGSLVAENNNWKQKVYELLVQSASSDELHASEINKYKNDINNYSEGIKLKESENEKLKETISTLKKELERIQKENDTIKDNSHDSYEKCKLLEQEIKNKNEILLTLLSKMEMIQNGLNKINLNTTKKMTSFNERLHTITKTINYINKNDKSFNKKTKNNYLNQDKNDSSKYQHHNVIINDNQTPNQQGVQSTSGKSNGNPVNQHFLYPIQQAFTLNKTYSQTSELLNLSTPTSTSTTTSTNFNTLNIKENMIRSPLSELINNKTIKLKNFQRYSIKKLNYLKELSGNLMKDIP